MLSFAINMTTRFHMIRDNIYTSKADALLHSSLFDNKNGAIISVLTFILVLCQAALLN